MIITTTENLVGKQIVEIKGLVEGVSLHKNLFWGSYEKEICASKKIAKERLVKEAEKIGANAIIALRYTTTNTTLQGAGKIIVYGTAVVIK